MKVFLIIVGVLVVLIALLMSLSATMTLIYDGGWHTSVQVLFIKKDIVLSRILSFILFPEQSAEQAREKGKKKKEKKEDAPEPPPEDVPTEEAKAADTVPEKAESEKALAKEEDKPKKPNYFQQLWDKDGVIGYLLLISNLVETASSAVTTLFRGFHIYSLYVKMIIGGADAADIAEKYGTLCSFYYPVKGMILNGMKVDQYDDYIQPDFIAPRSEYEFQLIGSLSVGLLVRMLLRAGIVFLKNFIKDK